MATTFGARFREVTWTSLLPHLGQQAKGGLAPRRKRSPQARQLWARRNGTRRSQPRRWERLTSELKHLGQKTTTTPGPFALCAILQRWLFPLALAVSLGAQTSRNGNT